MTGQQRLTSLDGLRGIAAVVVMFYHLSLVARPFIETGRTGDAWWWLTQTPLKIVTAGTEAVLVFFVLSGVVVALPALRTGFNWLGYYVSRPLRLYLPVWGSLALVGILLAVLPRDLAAVTDGSWLARGSARTFSLPQLLSEGSLFRASYDANNVLWSLRWELIFSLCLPLFVVLARALRDQAVLAAGLAIVLTVAGRVVDLDALVYLPVFFLGTLMAVRMPDLRSWATQRSRGFWAVTTATSLGLLIGSWLLRPVESARASEVLWGLAAVGAAGLVLVAVGSSLAERVLSAAVPRWLGRMSFSLYLVQAPVIATIAFALGDAQWPLVIAVAIPACVVVAWGFNVVVERPSHRLARRVARLGRTRTADVAVSSPAR